MKIIDLLNKIANGEELPKRIIYKGTVWHLEQEFSNRLPYYKNGYNMDNLLSGEEKDYFSQSLNDEVEILEEEKKIPEKLNISNFPKHNNSLKKTAIKLNEVIDYLKTKGDE